MASFRKRTAAKSIPETKISPLTGQLVTSSGNTWFDKLLGGGLPVGCMCLIEEDKCGVYSQILAKYFIAEGEQCKHSNWLGNLDVDLRILLSTLPGCIEDPEEIKLEVDEIKSEEKTFDDDNIQSLNGLRIAWRYSDLPLLNERERNMTIGHHYNLMKRMDINKIACQIWSGCANDTPDDDNDQIKANIDDSEDSLINYGFTSPEYISCMKSLLRFQNKTCAEPVPSKQLSRICLMSLGSPFWYYNDFEKDLLKFLTMLRAVMRISPTVCIITMPMHLISNHDQQLPAKIRTLVDYSIELEAIDDENSPYKEYSGFIKMHKMTAINTLNVFVPNTLDLAFKLKRKRLIIEELNLPPEIENENKADSATKKDDKGNRGTRGSGATKKDLKKQLDF